MSDDAILPLIFLGLIAAYAMVFYCLVRILRRLGYSGWWSLMLFVWPIGLIMLAHADWPISRRLRLADR